jgi:hypothetical protein
MHHSSIGPLHQHCAVRRPGAALGGRGPRSVALSLLASVVLCAAPLARAADASAQRHPDVVDVKVRASGVDRFDFDVTLSSPYDTPQRYADAFRVRDKAGNKVLGERILWHDHAGEQPFTRDLHGVLIPPGVKRVEVQGRDQRHGYGGKTMDVDLPGR